MSQLTRVFAPWTVLLLILSETVLVAGCYVLAIGQLIEGDLGLFLLYDNGAVRVAIVTLSILFGLYFVDLYTHINVRSRVWLAQQISLVIGCAFLLQAFLSYANRGLILPKWVMIEGSLASFIVLTLWRLLYDQFLLRALPRERVMLLGVSAGTQELATEIDRRPEIGATVVGCVCGPEECQAAGLRWLGSIDSFSQIVRDQQPTRLIVSRNLGEQAIPYSELLTLRMQGVIIEDATTAFERTFGRMLIADLHPSEFLFGERLGPGPFLSKVQAVYSFVIALIGAIITSPLMLLTALAVKLTSKGPILFRQNRVGQNGEVFKIWKFRSMYVNVDPFTGPKGRDPRITPIGYYLRKLRLDELPQFFNVLRGEMLIVGPRPEIPEFTKLYVEKIPVYQQRLLVKPGITGWAQINHKVEEQLEDTVRKLGYDLYYLKYTSLTLDMYVLFHTAKIMLLSRGAR